MESNQLLTPFFTKKDENDFSVHLTLNIFSILNPDL
jgi:hypothetical protein